ncbi:hypothetical protein E0485_18830 [Paenibacillus albiflavus]|uniref:Uncharacterized protein n=1 Tax=Paenibacillus albiflavus TaxID=2545760 RepID=A0A4R4E6R0_9BACL|nr:hypothetical protein [Paenibacillus albiflavus]TCZ75199.1 hypothetical protein E0485_18830 [Paenibacillus albiflavus]
MRKKRRLARAQLDYMAAKEHFLLTSKQTDIKLDELREEGIEIGQKEMEDVITRSGLHKAFNELINAENILIEWSHTSIKITPEYKADREMYENLYNNVKNDPEGRKTIIEMAMLLDLD